MHLYEVRPRKDKRGGFDLISDALPFGRLWYAGTDALEAIHGMDAEKLCSQPCKADRIAFECRRCLAYSDIR